MKRVPFQNVHCIRTPTRKGQNIERNNELIQNERQNMEMNWYIDVIWDHITSSVVVWTATLILLGLFRPYHHPCEAGVCSTNLLTCCSTLHSPLLSCLSRTPADPIVDTPVDTQASYSWDCNAPTHLPAHSTNEFANFLEWILVSDVISLT